MNKKTFLFYFIPGLIVMGAIIALMFIGCGAATGELEVKLDNTIREKTILPAQSMEVTQYEITITGPDNIDPFIVTESTTVPGLYPGQYTVLVKGLNAAGTAIGEGSEVVDVAVGTVSSCTVIIEEYLTPDGSISGLLGWQPDIINNPVVTGYVKDSAGTQTDLTFTLDLPNCEATTSLSPMSVGFYTLVNQVYDDVVADDSLSCGFADVIRVVAGQDTPYNVNLTANQATGQIEIMFDNQIVDPLALTFDTAPGTFDVMNTETVTINLTDAEGTAHTTAWYVNGSQEAFDVDTFSIDGSTYTVGSTYRLDCIVFTTDGSRAGSASWEFTVIDLPPYLFNILWTPTAGIDYTIFVVDNSIGTNALEITDNSGDVEISDGQLSDGDYYFKIRGEDAAGIVEFEVYEETQTLSNATVYNLPNDYGTQVDFGSLMAY
jgi:hypothetical protein